MSACWYCHWGWPKAVAMIYKEALRRLDGDSSPLEGGPAHVVWSDENFDLAEHCLNPRAFELADDLSEEEKAVVRWSLEQLSKVPSQDMDEPAGYDGEHPERFPPTFEVIPKSVMAGWAAEFRPKTVWDRLGALAQDGAG